MDISRGRVGWAIASKRRNTQLPESLDAVRAASSHNQQEPNAKRAARAPAKVVVVRVDPRRNFPHAMTRNGSHIYDGKFLGKKFDVMRKPHGHDVQTLYACDHPNVARLLRVCYSENTMFLLSEFVDVSLREITALPEKLSAKEIAFICRAVSV
jgi:serine/threonine protein kinase